MTDIEIICQQLSIEQFSVTDKKLLMADFMMDTYKTT